MAYDEAMLRSALEDRKASVRFYGWSEPTASLGYFQPVADFLGYDDLRRLAWVRRQTGGATIVHHRELTYALALPSGPLWHNSESWLCRFHHALTQVLSGFGVVTRSVVCGEEQKLGPQLCFLHQTPADLKIEGHKVVGSAQRRPHGALLQHGSILLERSPHTPHLPGIAELSGVKIDPIELRTAIVNYFGISEGWLFESGEWLPAEHEWAADSVRTKYGTEAWNRKY